MNESRKIACLDFSFKAPCLIIEEKTYLPAHCLTTTNGQGGALSLPLWSAHKTTYHADETKDIVGRAHSLTRIFITIFFKEGVDALRIEGRSFGSRGSGDLMFSHLYLTQHCRAAGIGVEEVPPVSLKRQWTGRANANKQDMIDEMIKRRVSVPHNIKPQYLNDFADAIALKHYSLKQLKKEE
jgi:Holliday junction resolvasome RuvABC endonuclease subunit